MGVAGYGNPESGQTVVNVTNGKIIRLLVEDEPFDVRYGELRSHERVLDLRAGLLHRVAEWVSPTARRVRVSSTRLVSFSQRAVAAILYEVEQLDGQIPVVIQSELVANESMPEREMDPRVAAALASPLRAESSGAVDRQAVLTHMTSASELRLSAAMGHVIDGPEGVESSIESYEDLARLTVSADVSPGKPLRLVKFLAYGWSSQRSLPAVRDQVGGAVAEAEHRSWDALVAEQRAYLDDFWERADVEIDGDAELQQAVRFALFHILQAGARAEQRAIAAKGLTGSGYDATRSGTRRRSCCRSSPTPLLVPPPMRFAGDTRRSSSRASGRGSSVSAPTCLSRPRGCGAPSGVTTRPGGSGSTA